MPRIIGNEGSVTIGANSVGGGTHAITANAWSMTISRVVSDVTAFGDTAGTVRGGIPTYTGSISGFLLSQSDPSVDAEDDFATGTTCEITLISQAGNQFVCSTAVISGFSFSSSKTGDMTVSMDFTLSGGVTTSWGD